MVYQRKKRIHEAEILQQVLQPQTSLFTSPDLETDDADNSPYVPQSTAGPSLEDYRRMVSQPPAYEAKAVVMYLQEILSKEQKGMYKELGKKYGAVNINKALEMSKLMQAIESSMYKRENISEDSIEVWSKINWQNFHVHILLAIKQISQNLDLSDAVINKLKSGSVSNLEEFAQENPSVKTLLSRWKIHTDMVKENISRIKKDAYAETLPFLNNDM
ncbi:MAG: hypothetical protein AAFW84_31070 [Cyanobacteria bacterium J06635_15]